MDTGSPHLIRIFGLFTFRELEEECCLKAKSLTEAGILLFEFVGDPIILEVHVFRTEEFEGQPTETEGKFVFSLFYLLL